ncbi:ABC transporter permease [Flavihumibacter petaseus]|uniref:Putative ABC transporter permease protein n=1 Tax=Flavihumibacter petaseus NBRC 106054 TaxID=1220578 RepID=A0A0E9N1F6_9BACT|nr:ABC transporter permease [Flavihumibacter petaseus]GAO43175.1 putative ABC transporter permease protein [Flavihumibacter petaseus NBRC 106054]
MFRNYFLTAVRNLLHHKTYSVINIAGLSFGLACVLCILLYVNDEVSYDRFHHHTEQIYRIDKTVSKEDGRVSTGSYTGYFPGPRFAAKIPDIQQFVRFQTTYADIKNGSEIQSQTVSIADANFFTVFNFPLLHGSAATALSRPNSVVITEDVAKKFFGSTDVTGNTISIKGQEGFTPYEVTAVARNCPQNSSIRFEIVMPLQVSAADENKNENWFNSFLTTFVVLSPGAELAAVNQKMNRVFEADANESISLIRSRYGIQDIGISYVLEPLADIHLGKMVSSENESLFNKSNPTYSWILSAVAVFILLIACINFVNLSVARSSKRAKEIGIRKLMGGSPQQLMIRFMGESFILCIAAFALALVIVSAFLPVFNQLTSKALSLSYLLQLKSLASCAGILVITGLLAGFYPALVLSAYQPVKTIYNRVQAGGGNYLQKALVVVQFSLATFLIAGTLAIFLQANFLTTQKLGYDDSDLITVNKAGLSRKDAALFKQLLLEQPGVAGVAFKNQDFSGNTVKVNGETNINVIVETPDEGYLPLLKAPILSGRNFSAAFASDPVNAALVNETFVKEAGWKEPLGQKIESIDGGRSYFVVGVVKDYHFKPMTEKVTPQLFTMNPNNDYGTAYIKIKPGTASASLLCVSKTFSKLFPLDPFVYSFKQEQNENSYAAERRWKKMILASAMLTIFISCIGLFGLSVLSAERRTKEIGVRKVLGASAGNILALLSTGFLKLVFISLLIALPASWLATNQWLQHYPYRITLSWWLFGASGLLVTGIALATVSFHSLRAAMANPVKSLRTE